MAGELFHKIGNLQAYDEKQTQATMDSFLTYRQRFAKIKSKRLANAVKKSLKGARTGDKVYLSDPEEHPPDKPKAKRKRKTKQPVNVLDEEDPEEIQDSPPADSLPPKPKRKPRGKGKRVKKAK